MASSRHTTHQDYIARIRYSNALPPPPFAPKLLEIANAGLASGQYTSSSFASRLAREQPLNIEADAELGMEINMVGLPGVFEGDESVIIMPENPQPLDPRDRALLKPLSALGKPTAAADSITFLRRTEYITSHRGVDSASTSNVFRTNNNAKTAARRPNAAKPLETAKNDPTTMIRAIEKSFNIAYPHDTYTGPDTAHRVRGAEPTRQEREAWEKPRHPTNPKLTVLDSYPVLPDIAALGDGGTYMLIKYQTKPTTDFADRYDERLDHVLLAPAEQTEEQLAQFEAARDLYKENPTKNPEPLPVVDFHAYIPDGEPSEILPGLKRKFSVFDSERNSDDLYAAHPVREDGQPGDDVAAPCFKFSYLRMYHTYQQTGDGAVQSRWNDSVGVALHDAEDGLVSPYDEGRAGLRQKAAYVYPISQRTFVRPKRKGVSKTGISAIVEQRDLELQEKDLCDAFELRIEEPDEEETAKMEIARRTYDEQMV